MSWSGENELRFDSRNDEREILIPWNRRSEDGDPPRGANGDFELRARVQAASLRGSEREPALRSEGRPLGGAREFLASLEGNPRSARKRSSRELKNTPASLEVRSAQFRSAQTPFRSKEPTHQTPP